MRFMLYCTYYGAHEASAGVSDGRAAEIQTEEETMKHTRWGISLAADVSAPRKA